MFNMITLLFDMYYIFRGEHLVIQCHGKHILQTHEHKPQKIIDNYGSSPTKVWLRYIFMPWIALLTLATFVGVVLASF